MAIGEQKEQLLRCIPYDLFGKGRNTNSIFDATKMICLEMIENALTKLVFLCFM